MNSSENQKPNINGRTKSASSQKSIKVIFIMLIAAVVILGALLVYTNFFQTEGKSGNDGSAAGNGLSLAENAEEWNKTLENAGGSENGIKIPGYGDIEIPENSEKANITLLNPEGNPCYFQYTLKIDDTVLYSSDLIEPGKAIMEIDLKNLPAPGTYDLIMEISTYSFDENLTPMNGAEVKTTLVVT